MENINNLFTKYIYSSSPTYYKVSNPECYYNFSDLIGEGGTAFIYKGTCNRSFNFFHTPPTRAIKVMRVNKRSSEIESENELEAEKPKLMPAREGKLCDVLNELKIMQDLQDCEYIVKLHEAFHEDKRWGEFWIVTDYYKFNLNQVMRYTDKPLEYRQIKIVSSCVALAIEHMHKKNIIHGDIKGSNILLSADGQIRLCDFGISKEVNSRTSVLTTSEFFYGTLSYAPPELFQKGSDYSFPIDIFAFACTVIEMKTGAPPFQKGVLMPYEAYDMHDLEDIYNKRVSLRHSLERSKERKREIDVNADADFDIEIAGNEYEDILSKSDIRNIFVFARRCLIPEDENNSRPKIEEILEKSFFTGMVNQLRTIPLSASPKLQKEIANLVQEAEILFDAAKRKEKERVENDLIVPRGEDRFGFVHL